MTKLSIRPRTRLFSLLATAAVACLVAAVGIAPATAGQGPVQAETAKKKKKKCGKKKKGKKGAVAAKKCKKKKGGATGPSLPIGEWACGNPIHSTLHTQSGNRYYIHEANKPGTYRYYPDTGIVQFQGGEYSWAFGKYNDQLKNIEIYSNVNEDGLEVGDYGWSCAYFD